MKRILLLTNLMLWAWAAVLPAQTDSTYTVPEVVLSEVPVVNSSNGRQYYQYTVQPRQTFYSLCRTFSISQEELQAMNPFLADGLKAGQVLTIPVNPVPQAAAGPEQPAPIAAAADGREPVAATDSGESVSETPAVQETAASEAIASETAAGPAPYQPADGRWYTVTARKEYLSDIALANGTDVATLRLLNVNVPDELRRGSRLILPALPSEQPMAEDILVPEETPDTLAEVPAPDHVSVALLLPFMLDDTTGITSERYMEFYEGMLLAADTLRRLGHSADLAVYDVGHSLWRMQKVLSDNDFSTVTHVVAYANADQVDTLSDWAREHQVKLVMPFSSRIAQTASNPYMIQVNPPHALTYEALLAQDTALLSGKNILLLRNYNEESDERSQLFRSFRQKLISHGISFHELVEYQDDEHFQDTLAFYLKNHAENLVVPAPSSLTDANRVIGMVAAAKNQHNSSCVVSMYGYPEWLALNKNTLPVLHSLNTTLYANYYADFEREDLRRFQVLYSRCFGKDLLNTIPRYGLMGYDLLLWMAGGFSQVDVKPLQHTMDLVQPTAGGGLYNRSVVLLNYAPDGTLVQTPLTR